MGRAIRVEVDGLDRLQRRLDQLPDEIRQAAEQAVADEVDAVASDMRENAPVASGELRDSIEGEVDGLSGTVRARARHAVFVEHGTSSTPEQPFAQPAAEVSRRRFPRRLPEAVRRELRK